MFDRYARYYSELMAKIRGDALKAGQPVPPPPIPIPYKAFTTAYDQEVSAADALNAAYLPGKPPANRTVFSSTIAAQGHAMKAAALLRGIEFQKKWVGGHDLGEKPLITLLIDHSGSMRGLRAMTAAVVADTVGATLEFNKIAFDVLGFTTNSWKGGDSCKAWVRAGCPPYPGRLCDLLHIIYRDALKHGDKATRWRDDLLLILQDNVLKENIDGEALQWAHSRATQFGASTWICLVISDGAPVDDTTLTVSGPNILHDHIQEVSKALRSQPNVRLGGIGIEYNVGLYYPISKSTPVLAESPIVAFEVLEELIWPVEVPEPASVQLH